MQTITNKQICSLFSEAANYTDQAAFASDAAISCLDPENQEQDIDLQLFEQLQILWQICNSPFKEFLALLGFNQTQCAERFCIPLRTVQDWAGERRTPPLYVRLMMAEAVGLLKLR